MMRSRRTRFICASKSWHVHQRGGPRHRKRDSAGFASSQDTGQFKRAIDMTDDELATIVAKARLTVVK